MHKFFEKKNENEKKKMHCLSMLQLASTALLALCRGPCINTITESDVSSPDIQIVGRRKLALEIYHFNGWWLHFDRCISLFVGNYPAIMPSYGNCRRLLTHC